MFHRLSPAANRVLMALAIFTFACWSFAAAAILTWGPGRAAAAKTAARITERIAGRRATHTIHPRLHALPTLRLAEAGGCAYGYSTDAAGADFSWALLDEDGSMFTDSGDGHRFRAQGRKGTPTFWFRDDDGEYVVTDPNVVDDVRRVTAPVRELGREMGVLGGEMGRRGVAVGRLGGRLGAMSARLAMLEARMARRSASVSARAETQDERRRLRQDLERIQQQLGEEQEGHALRQRELSRRMSELSARHGEAYRRAKAEVREIARKAKREGKAERPHANA